MKKESGLWTEDTGQSLGGLEQVGVTVYHMKKVKGKPGKEK
jgi:hypothetical protein